MQKWREVGDKPVQFKEQFGSSASAQWELPHED